MTIALPEDLILPENTTLIPNMKAFYADDDIGGVLIPCYVRLDLPSPVTPARMARIRRLAGAPANALSDARIARELDTPLDNSSLHRELESRGIYLRPSQDSTLATLQLLDEPSVVGVVVSTRHEPDNGTEDWWIIRDQDRQENPSTQEEPDLETPVSAQPATQHSLTIQNKTVFLHELSLSDLRVLMARISERFSEECDPEEERALTPEHWPLSAQAEGRLWVTVISIPDDDSMSANDAADQTVIGATPGMALNDLQHEDHPTIPGAYLTFAQLNAY